MFFPFSLFPTPPPPSLFPAPPPPTGPWKWDTGCCLGVLPPPRPPPTAVTPSFWIWVLGCFSILRLHTSCWKRVTEADSHHLDSCGHVAISARSGNRVATDFPTLQAAGREGVNPSTGRRVDVIIHYFVSAVCYVCRCGLHKEAGLHVLPHHFLFLERLLHFYCLKFLLLHEHKLWFLVWQAGYCRSHWLDCCSYTGHISPVLTHPFTASFRFIKYVLSSLSVHVPGPCFMWVSTELFQQLIPTSKHLSWHVYYFLGCLPACHPPWLSGSREHRGGVFLPLPLLGSVSASHLMLWACLVDAFKPLFLACMWTNIHESCILESCLCGTCS